MNKLVIGFGIVILVISGVLVWNKIQPGNNAVVQVVSRVLPLPTPTPMPFAEMTIPHLRNRQYTSALADLQQLSTNANYTSFTTSYLSDSLRINALITKPTGNTPAGGWPAIVFVHGYIPPAQYRTTQNYASYVDYLARNGFVVFKIDLRGHGDSEGEPGGSYYSSDYIIDTLNARAALQASDFVNPNSIGLWGHSMAGNVVMRSLVVQTDIPAISIWAGAVYSYTDFQKYGIDDNSYQPPANDTERQRKRRELFATHGEFNLDSNFWRQVAATNYLGDIKGAIQLNHAIDDAVVDIGFSRDLKGLLQEASVTHELNEYQSGGHNISGASFTASMQNTVEFFNTYLK